MCAVFRHVSGACWNTFFACGPEKRSCAEEPVILAMVVAGESPGRPWAAWIASSISRHCLPVVESCQLVACGLARTASVLNCSARACLASRLEAEIEEVNSCVKRIMEC